MEFIVYVDIVKSGVFLYLRLHWDNMISFYGNILLPDCLTVVLNVVYNPWNIPALFGAVFH